MNAPTVFVTGVTGYIGGDALHVIYHAHPDWHYRFLIRDAERSASVFKNFPTGEAVLGSLEDLSLLEKEAASADIVMNFASSDDIPSVQAIAAGLASRDHSKPGYLIHVSGSANIIFEDMDAGIFGDLRDRVWDDIRDIEAIKSIPEHAIHRPIEKLVMESGAPAVPHVRRAIVCPPTIVGTGRGPVNNRSLGVPILVELIKQRSRGFQIGRGLSRWSIVHIHDLSSAFLALIEDAARDGNDPEVWGLNAFHFVENGECEWGAVSRRVTKRLHEKRPDLVPSDEVDEVQPDAVQHLFPFATGLWGANSRSGASRLRKVLGWKPLYDDFDAQYDAAVDFELEEAKQSRLQDWSEGHIPMIPKTFAQ